MGSGRFGKIKSSLGRLFESTGDSAKKPERTGGREDLRTICERAYAGGQGIDLSCCSYGKSHKDDSAFLPAQSYYYFFAGFVKDQGIRSILEIGSHFGGSIIAMSMGMDKELISSNTLVTVDITSDSDAALKEYPFIRKIKGDSLKPAIVEEVVSLFRPPIDLLFIDSVHNYKHTRGNLDIYAPKLNPRYVAFHDIHINDSMEKLWREVTEEFGDDAFDASKTVKQESVGFGVVRWR